MNKEILATAALSLLAFNASAGTISFNNSFGPEVVPLASTSLAPLSLFDPSLGTLTQVELTLEADAFAGLIRWDNEAGIATDVTLGIGAQVTITTSFGNSLVAIPMQLGSALDVAADNDGSPDFVGSDSFSVTGATGSDMDNATLTSAIDLANYTGLGTFAIDIEAVVQNYLSTTGGFGPTSPTAGQTGGTVTVEYTYDVAEVPVPAAAWLFGSALLGLGAIKRKKA